MTNIFVGFSVTNAMKESFANCSPKNLVYLENSEYLEFATIGGCEYVGKCVKSGAAVDRLEDTARSVVSLLAKVSSDWTLPADEAVLLAYEEHTAAPKPAEAEEGGEKDDFDYLGLVD